MNNWKLFKVPKMSGFIHMQTDLKMFEDFEAGLIPSTLRIYSWKPKCISLGYAQKIDRLIDLSMASRLGWEIVKRPTGGGIVFHNEAEVTYSLVTNLDNPRLPKGLVPSYKRLSQAIVYGLKVLNIPAEIQSSKFLPAGRHGKIQNKSQAENSKSQLCFSYPAEYEVVVNGNKIVGSAQKRGRRALLQQGSILVTRFDPKDFVVLKNNFEEYNAVSSVEEVLGRKIGFEELAQALICGFEETLVYGFENDQTRL